MKERGIHKKISSELNLILQFLSPDLSASYLDSSNKINDNEFLRLVKHHRLESILYQSKSFEKTVLSPSLQEKLNTLNKRNKMRMIKLSSELIIISKKLNKENIDFVVLKGPVLSQQIYDDFSVRNYRDIDILVSPKDIIKAKEVLEKVGYSTKSKYSTIGKLNNKELKFLNSEKKTMVELHHRFFNNKLLFPFLDEYFNNSETVQINSYKIPILSNSINFLYLITHAAAHNWSRLTWALDVIAFRRLMSPEDLSDAKELAKKVGLEKVFKQAVKSEIFDFVSVSNEQHYTLLKRMSFLMSLNSKTNYKWQELIQRAMIPYRYIFKS